MAPLKGSHLYRGNLKLSKITEDLHVILEARRKIFLIGKARLTTIFMLIDSVCMPHLIFKNNYHLPFVQRDSRK